MTQAELRLLRSLISHRLASRVEASSPALKRLLAKIKGMQWKRARS